MAYRDRDSGMIEEVIAIRFHTKVTKGGRNLSCAALVAVGDGEGRAGLGYGKAKGVPMAIEKASKEARGTMVDVNLIGDTIAHQIVGKHKTAEVLLKPARPGTGVKAGSTVRALMHAVGVHNVLSKSFGSTNPVNVARATMKALADLRSPQEVEALRGRKVDVFHPQARAHAAREAPPAAVGEPEAADAEAGAEERKPDAG